MNLPVIAQSPFKDTFLRNYMCLPLFKSSDYVGLLCLGNSSSGYSNTMISQLYELIAHYAPALLTRTFSRDHKQ